jgi:uncharacterized protein (DUF362 family)
MVAALPKERSPEVHMRQLDRRTVVGGGFAMGATAVLGSPAAAKTASGAPDLVAAQGPDAFASTLRAVEALGGIGRFVPRGATVGLLINGPKYWRLEGSYTRPELALAVAKLCLDAGAKQVTILSPLAPGFWKRTPLAEKEASVLRALKASRLEDVERPVPKGVALKKVSVSKDLLESDVFINLPIAKHHRGAGFTGNLKNFMGARSRKSCEFFHEGSAMYAQTGEEDAQFLAQCIADVNTLRAPTLCVSDATVVLASNGPAGPGDLLRPGKVVAGVDPVAVDTYAVGLHGVKAAAVPMLGMAVLHGLGRSELGELAVRELPAGTR